VVVLAVKHHTAFANAVSWLDNHEGAVTVLLTAVLIAVTAYYAIQNAHMVGEMRRARLAALMPKLAIEFQFIGPVTATVAIRNVGPGAALDIDVRLIYERVQNGREAPERRWRRNVLSSGEQFDFGIPGETQGQIDSLASAYRAIRLVGKMKDAAGSEHKVDESFEDLAEWREVLEQAHVRWSAADPERRLAEALDSRFGSQFKNVTTAINGVASVLGQLQPASGDRPWRRRFARPLRLRQRQT